MLRVPLTKLVISVFAVQSADTFGKHLADLGKRLIVLELAILGKAIKLQEAPTDAIALQLVKSSRKQGITLLRLKVPIVGAA